MLARQDFLKIKELQEELKSAVSNYNWCKRQKPDTCTAQLPLIKALCEALGLNWRDAVGWTGETDPFTNVNTAKTANETDKNGTNFVNPRQLSICDVYEDKHKTQTKNGSFQTENGNKAIRPVVSRCLNCSKPLEGLKATAKFCPNNNKCKNAYNNARNKR